MLTEIIDMMIDEKMSCEEYKELAEEQGDEEIKGMLMKISEDEHNHYRMLKEWIKRMYPEE